MSRKPQFMSGVQEIAPAVDKLTPRSLSNALRSLLEIPLETPLDQFPETTRQMLFHAISFFPDSPELGRTWAVLHKALSSPQSSVETRLKAFFIADTLLFQTKTSQEVPWPQDITFKFFKQEANLKEEPTENPSIYQEVEESVAKFKNELETLKIAPGSEEEAMLRLTMADALYRMQGSAFIDFASTFANDLGHETVKWTCDLVADITDYGASSPFYYTLLINGKLEDLNKSLLFVLFLTLNRDLDYIGDPERKLLADYFFTHPSLQESFWSYAETGEEKAIVTPQIVKNLLYASSSQAVVSTIPDRLRMNSKFIREFTSIIEAAVRSPKTVAQPQEKPEEVINNDNRFSLEEGELLTIERWGEVQTPRKEVLSMLFAHLAKTNLGNLDEEKLFNLASLYQKRAGKNASLTILSSLLEENHPLSVLAKMGIIAVEPDNNGVRFIIDAASAKIKTVGPQTITVFGSFSEHGDLEIEGIEPYSPLHLLLSASAYATKAPVMDRTLTRDEVRDVNGLVKSWNSKAKQNNWPEVTYDPENRVGENRIILPVGREKTAILTFR